MSLDANLLVSSIVKTFLKSANISHSYQRTCCRVFMDYGVAYIMLFESNKKFSWQQVLSRKYKYKYKYFKSVVKYSWSISTSTTSQLTSSNSSCASWMRTAPWTVTLMNALRHRLTVAHVDIAASRRASTSPSSCSSDFSGTPFSEQLMRANTYSNAFTLNSAADIHSWGG